MIYAAITAAPLFPSDPDTIKIFPYSPLCPSLFRTSGIPANSAASLHRTELFPSSSTSSRGDPIFTTRNEPTAAEFREINCPTFGAENVTV